MWAGMTVKQSLLEPASLGRTYDCSMTRALPHIP
jgi:hypothetical protein